MILNKKLAGNTLIMTASSLFMSAVSMAYRAWLAGKIGTAGIGLYQLVLSVTALVMTFAISGVRFASTRLVSEELAAGEETVNAAMLRCFSYAMLFGTAAGAVLFFSSEPIGFLWLGDARTVRPLRLSALSMPCAALCSAMSGYFTAVGRIWKPAAVHTAELLCGAALSVKLVSACRTGNIEQACYAVTLARVTADVFSFALMSAAYYFDRRRYAHGKPKGGSFAPRMLKIALPLAFSAYTRSALSTLQHILVPRGLKQSGLSADRALSGYGVIHGMALPVIFFPACVMSAAAELVVPELTSAQINGENDKINRSVDGCLRLALVFSAGVSAVLFLISDIVGEYIFKNEEAGFYIRLLAPLVPVMYTDMMVDGCLKGLGQHIWNMKVNILDSALSAILVWRLLPRYALKAYIGIIYFTEILNFVLSYARLNNVTERRSPQCVSASSHRLCAAGERCACREDMSAAKRKRLSQD